MGLDLPLDVRGTAFQQRVWRALQKIPVGKTASYADLAKRIGAPKAVRAVANAVRGQSDRGCDPLSPGGAQGRHGCRAIAGASNASGHC